MKKEKIFLFISHLIVYLLFSLCLFSQERKNEELPRLVDSITSVKNLTGWARNDVGKWEQAFNGIPFGAQVQKIEVSKITYEGKEFFCIAQFEKNIFYRQNQKYFQYSADFWLIDSSTSQDLQYLDSNVYTRIYKNVIVSTVLGGLQPVKWNDILLQIKRCFIGTYPNDLSQNENFFIKYRQYDELKKTQFFIGSIDKTLYDFTNNNMCYDDAKNEDLNCCYFEVSKIIFEKTFHEIIE